MRKDSGCFLCFLFAVALTIISIFNGLVTIVIESDLVSTTTAVTNRELVIQYHDNVCCNLICETLQPDLDNPKLFHCVGLKCLDESCFNYQLYYNVSGVACLPDDEPATSNVFATKEEAIASANQHLKDKYTFVSFKRDCHSLEKSYEIMNDGLGQIMFPLVLWLWCVY